MEDVLPLANNDDALRPGQRQTQLAERHAWLGDERAAIVVASAGVAVYTTGIVIWRGRQFLRAGGSWTRTALVLFALGPIASLLFWANALVLGSLAVYALALCIQLSVAVVSFYSLVSAAE